MRILVIGAGRCGIAIAEMLSASGDYEVTLADSADEARSRAATSNLPFVFVDGTRQREVERMLPGFDAVVAAVPSSVCPFIAAAAVACGVAYLDLADIPEIAADGRRTGAPAIPSCGFSPGLVNDIASDLSSRMAGPFDMTVRAGALPIYPTNRLGYGLSWNVDDLIEEYSSPGDAIRGGQPIKIAPLEGLENLVLDGARYEAFTTGAAASSLPAMLMGRAENFVFKTIRYPGHLELIRFLLEDLGLRSRQDHLRTLLQNGLPEISQDVLLLFITVRSARDGRQTEQSDCRRISYGRLSGGRIVSALPRASAAHLCTMLDLLRSGAISGAGIIRHEAVPLASIAGNRFLAGLGL